MGTATTPVIDYAPRRASFVRRHAKRLVVLAAVLSIAITAYLVREPVGRWVMWQYWYRKAVAEPVVNPNPATTMPATQPTRAMREVLARCHFPLGSQNVDQPYVVFAGMMKRPDGAERFVFIGSDRVANFLVPGASIWAVVQLPPGVAQSGPTQVGDNYAMWERECLFYPSKVEVASRSDRGLLIPMTIYEHADTGVDWILNPGGTPKYRRLIAVELNNDDEVVCHYDDRDAPGQSEREDAARTFTLNRR